MTAFIFVEVSHYKNMDKVTLSQSKVSHLNCQRLKFNARAWAIIPHLLLLAFYGAQFKIVCISLEVLIFR
jgi:hypothetical protein